MVQWSNVIFILHELRGKKHYVGQNIVGRSIVIFLATGLFIILLIQRTNVKHIQVRQNIIMSKTGDFFCESIGL